MVIDYLELHGEIGRMVEGLELLVLFNSRTSDSVRPLAGESFTVDKKTWLKLI